MREDFVTKLEQQLRDAEERQQHPRTARGRMGTARAPSRGAVLAVGTAAAIVVAVGIAAVTLTGGKADERAAGTGAPRIVERFAVTDHPMYFAGPGIAAASGSTWVAGSERRQVLRVDAAGRVVGRVPVDVDPSGIAGGGDGVWVAAAGLGPGAVLRIDPASGRIVSRIPIRGAAAQLTAKAVGGIAGAPVLAGPDGGVWVLGGRGGAHIAAGDDRITDTVAWRLGDIVAGTFAVAGNDLWVRAGDGRLLRYDAATGARQNVIDGPVGTATIAASAGEGVVVGGATGDVAYLAASSGRARWETTVDGTVQHVAIASGAVWVLHATSSARSGVTLTALDARTGRSLGEVPMTVPGLSEYTIAPLRGDLWVTTPDDRVLVVSR